jgi:hypothetical protein
VSVLSVATTARRHNRPKRLETCEFPGSWNRLKDHPASVSSGLVPVTGGVVFSKLSKLLNQEGALSVPCLRGAQE